jgi:branched-chain amino acid transport system substrate-binding protein
MVHYRKLFLLTCVIALLALTLFGCGGQQQAPAGQEGDQEMGVIQVGFTGPLSGGSAKYGQNCLDGMNLALSEINSTGVTIEGKKYKIELATLDDRYRPNEAATNARRLVQQNKATVIFCPHAGGISALAQFNEQEGFILAGYTSSPEPETLGNKLIIRIPTPYPWYLGEGGFIDQAMERFGKNAVCVPGVHEYAKGWTDIFIEAWEQEGGTVTGNYPVDYTTEADFYTPVSKALADNPDVMFVGGPSEPTSLVIKQARELGFEGGFIVMDQAKVNEIENFLPMPPSTIITNAFKITMWPMDG